MPRLFADIPFHVNFLQADGIMANHRRLEFPELHLMTFVAASRKCAAPPAENLNKSNCSWATHPSRTTERYLGTKQDLVHAPNDGIKLRVAV